MWILDGINNAGFSGGPVIVGTDNDLKIVAVISGYSLEPTDVIRGDPKAAADGPKNTVGVNSGFILAYDISHAVDLIKKNPTGPVRAAKKQFSTAEGFGADRSGRAVATVPSPPGPSRSPAHGSRSGSRAPISGRSLQAG
jgi:hypothetical protein